MTQGGSVSDSNIDIDIRFRLLRALERHQIASQRDLSRALGLSLGKTNYCVRQLMARGLVESRSLTRGHPNRRFEYRITTAGIAEKARIAHRFLEQKRAEHDELTREIREIQDEIATASDAVPEEIGKDS